MQKPRDRLACGVNDDRIKRKLLAKIDFTFDYALTLAKAMESGNNNLKEVVRQERVRAVRSIIATIANTHLKTVGFENQNAVHVELQDT